MENFNLAVSQLPAFVSSLKPLIYIPIIAPTTTLSLVESLQRHVTFNKPQLVGHVSSVAIAPVRTTKMLQCTSWRVTRTGLPLDRRIAVYDKKNMVKLHGGGGLGYKITGVVSRVEVKQGVKCSDVPRDVSRARIQDVCLILSHPSQEVDLKIDMGALQTRKRLFGLDYSDGRHDNREYVALGDEADSWMSRVLGDNDVTMLYLPQTKLSGDINSPVYLGQQSEIVPHNPVHLTCTATLDEINKSANSDLDIERFRANLVITGTVPREEQLWSVIRIGDQLELQQTFMNPRCSVINSLSGERSMRVYDVLSKHGPFRDKHKKMCFGTYWKVLREGEVREGDEVVVLRRMKEEISCPDMLTDQFILGLN